MRRKIKWIGLIIVVLGCAIQLYQPDRLNPPVDESRTIYASIQVPPEVRAVIERSCNDCHSYQTKWPWYSYIAPASWLVSNDVSQGRLHLNFSTWADYKKNRKANKLDGIADEVSDKTMPLKKYTLLHLSAKLSDSDIELISRWAEKEREKLSAPDSVEGDTK